MATEPKSEVRQEGPHPKTALDATPESVLFSTAPLGWRQLNVQRRIRPLGGVTDIPEGMREHVVLVWHGATHVRSQVGGMRHEVNAGTGPTQFIPARNPVCWERRSAFHFTKISLVSECVDAIMLELFDRDPARNPLEPRPIHDDPFLRARAGRLMSHALSDDPVNQLVVDAGAQQLGVHLIATYGGLSLRGRERRLVPGHLHSVIDYVEENLGREITLETLAALACASKYHFLRRFKLSTGMTPHQFVIQRRIRRAKELIRSDRLALAEIAHLTGFSDQAHFSRVFKQTVGVTPSTFRRCT